MNEGHGFSRFVNVLRSERPLGYVNPTTAADEGAALPFCHPERSRGICSLFIGNEDSLASSSRPLFIRSSLICLRQVEGGTNDGPKCCHSHLCTKWKRHPYLEGQSRRDDLNLAQDVVLGCVQREISSPGGTAESILTRFSRPYGTALTCVWIPRTDVLGYFQVVPSGLDIKAG